MCLAIMQPAGAKLPDSVFDNAWSRNSDGAGYMFAAGGKLIIRKPFFKLKQLRKAYAQDHRLYGASSPFVIHFRYATHGKCDETNTHPHSLCNGEIGLVHNGILPFDPPLSAGDISDTVWFCRTVLAFRAPGDVIGAHMRELMGEMIGTGNKFVLLSAAGEVSIVNEAQGTWDGGVWYSNNGYKSAKAPRRKWSFPAWDDRKFPAIGKQAPLWHGEELTTQELRELEEYEREMERDEEQRRIHGLAWDELTEAQWRERKAAIKIEERETLRMGKR